LSPYAWFALGLVATGLASFFALAHEALRTFSRTRLADALERAGRLHRLDRLTRHQDALVQTTRVLRVLALVTTVVLFEAWSLLNFESTLVRWLGGAAVAAALALVLGAVVPSAWARYAADDVLARILPILHVMRVALAPLRGLLGLVDAVVRRLAGVPEKGVAMSNIEEEIVQAADEGEREGAILEEQKDMIANVIKLKRSDASQIMTPRTDIVSVDADEDLETARCLIADSGFSRIPTTRGNLDTIVGILYAKDLLLRGPDESGETPRVAAVMREALFVPETKRLDELLRDFQANKVHIAVVLDEYGGTSGVVTIEDVIEEIVGEIVDEYEAEPAQPIQRIDARSYRVEARVHIDELNDELDLDLPEDEDYETIGGFILCRLGYIPKAGELLDADPVTLTVLEADERRIVSLRLDIADTSEASPEP